MSDLTILLFQHRDDFTSVVPMDPKTDKIIALDMTAANTDLSSDIVNDIDLFSSYIKNTIASHNARYAIGGYGEHRTIYSRSKVFDGDDEPRRLHLGLDIWGEPDTPVVAPLNGIVHSSAYNGEHGDYGATIILEHELDGRIFYSLYGHLSFADLQIKTGSQVTKGSIFAHFGNPDENGCWPPHLHYQLIEDIGSHKGDYPGVCRYSEKDRYLNNCPDPDLITRLYRYV